MTDERKTKAQLVRELADLRRRIAELEGRAAASSAAAGSIPRMLAETVANALLVEPTADPLFIFDGQVRFVATNLAAARSMGTTPQKIAGKSMYDLFPPPIADRQFASVKRVFETGEPVFSEENESRTADGPRWFNTSLTPVRGDGGEIRYVVGIARDVTDRKQAEEALAESRRELQAIHDSMADGILVADPETRQFREANPAICRMLGYSRDELLSMRVDDIHPPDQLDRVLETFEKQVRSEVPLAKDIPCRRKNGTVFFADIAASPLKHKGRLCAVAIFRNTTERKRAEDALRESEARYRAVVESQTELVNRFLPDGTMTFVNEALCRFTGKRRDELIGHRFLPYLPEEDWAAVLQALASITADNPVVHTEHRAMTTAGEIRWMAWANRGIFDARGRLVELQGVGRDVTEQKTAEEALRQSEANYRAIFNAAGDALFVHDIETGDVIDFNLKAAEVYGYTLDEIDRLNEQFRRSGDPPYAHEDQLRWLRRAAEDGPQLFEWLATDRRGRRFWVEVSLKRAVIGGRDRLLAALRDIADRKRAEEALRRSEEHYRALFEESLDGILVIVDGRIVRANQAFADIHRRPLEELVGREVMDLVHTDEREPASQSMQGVLAGRADVARDRRYRVQRADGTTALVEVLSNRIDWEGRPAIQAIVRDVTRQVRLEEQLRQALKMEAVGVLAGGIAHDFSNLMTGILGHADLLKAESHSPESVREAADLIRGAAQRATELTDQLLGFARRGMRQDVAVDLNATVETAVRLFSRSLDPRIRVTTRFCGEHALVRGDHVQVEQVVLNLAMNARDAMPDGGELSFITQTLDVRDEDCDRRPAARPGRYVVLSVADTGCGIPEEMQDRVFEPFYTTKPQGKGTGMGLAMVYGIVKDHGGWVEVASEAGRGTTFHVFLPEAEPPADPDLHAPPDAGRILVVDDEELARNAAVRLLSGLGYDVVAVGGGQEAIDYYRQDGRDVGAVVIDLMMPEMDGRRCFKALRQIDPDVRALLATGWGDEHRVQSALAEGMVGLARKPFQTVQLAKAVKQALTT